MIDLIDEIPLLKSAIINKQKEANFEQKNKQKNSKSKHGCFQSEENCLSSWGFDLNAYKIFLLNLTDSYILSIIKHAGF